MARLDPVVVRPLVRRHGDDRRRLRRQLCFERQRVGLLDGRPGDLELVALAALGTVDDSFPDAALVDRLEPIDTDEPVVEVADHAHVTRVRGPDRKSHAALDEVCAELRVELLVAPRPGEPDVELAEGGCAALCHGEDSSSRIRRIPATGIFTHSGRLFSS